MVVQALVVLLVMVGLFVWLVKRDDKKRKKKASEQQGGGGGSRPDELGQTHEN